MTKTKVVFRSAAEVNTVLAAHVSDRSGKCLDVAGIVPRTLDPTSQTFGDDLHRIFTANVLKARRANLAVIGTPDVVVED